MSLIESKDVLHSEEYLKGIANLMLGKCYKNMPAFLAKFLPIIICICKVYPKADPDIALLMFQRMNL